LSLTDTQLENPIGKYLSSCISPSNLKSLSILHPVEVPKALHSIKTTLNHLETSDVLGWLKAGNKFTGNEHNVLPRLNPEK